MHRAQLTGRRLRHSHLLGAGPRTPAAGPGSCRLVLALLWRTGQFGLSCHWPVFTSLSKGARDLSPNHPGSEWKGGRWVGLLGVSVDTLWSEPGVRCWLNGPQRGPPLGPVSPWFLASQSNSSLPSPD